MGSQSKVVAGSDIEKSHPQLRREVGLAGAVMMGLGSIIGTGVFVSLGIAAGVTGPSVVPAILAAAVVASLNGLSSAELAANHPVSGGTYEYGYRWLHPRLGFAAGWMFLCAKSASAATAALGFAGYGLNFLGAPAGWRVPLACGTVAAMTLLILGGIRRSNRVNIAIVSVTLLALACFVLAGVPTAWQQGAAHLSPFFRPAADRSAASGFLEACAMMFVAFTGYGRIATLGEEVTEPRTTIPRAIVATLVVSSLLYAAVGLVGVAAVGSDFLSRATLEKAAPLEAASRQFAWPGVAPIVAMGAVTAMLGVLLNLILGLSRVALAMGRRGDLPRVLGTLREESATPVAAVIAVAIPIGLLALLGNVKTTWSFSAFTVLVYYALTNLAATRLSAAERLFPPIVPWLGLASCLSLAFWVEPRIWGVGLAFLAGGWAVQWAMQRIDRLRSSHETSRGT